MKRYVIIPYLTGQRRDGLGRVNDVSAHPWELLDIPDFEEVAISDANEKLRRMGHIYALMAENVRQVVLRGDRPVCIAGDCFSSLGMLAGLQKAGKQPDRILWLDAHGDFHTWETTQTKYLGGMPLAILAGRQDRRRKKRDSIGALVETLGVTPFPEEKIILSDARDLDPGEKEALQKSNIRICKIEDIRQYLSPDESLYVHFDTDIIDARQDMPALKYHVRAGPTKEDISALFKSLRLCNIIAISVSAWHEEEDLDNKTAIACLNLLKELE